MKMNVEMMMRMKGMKINPKSCRKVRNGAILAVLVRDVGGRSMQYSPGCLPVEGEF